MGAQVLPASEQPAFLAGPPTSDIAPTGAEQSSGTHDKTSEKTAEPGSATESHGSEVESGSGDRILVQFDENDPENPQNWSVGLKCFITFQLGMLAFSGSLGSTVIAPAGPTISVYFGIGQEVVVLNVSLYIIGFAIGPLVWAPLSEVFGRKLSMLPALACLGLFSIGTAASTNVGSMFITRLLGGVFGSAAISNVSAALGDFWSRETRGTAMAIYAIAVVLGATAGPVIGAAILSNPRMGWRWTEYTEALVDLAIVGMSALCLPETYGPVLLRRKAVRLRKETGDDRYYHPHEEIKLDIGSIITKQLSRPLMMLIIEPMVTCIAFYASFVYGIIYLGIEIIHIVFAEERGWDAMHASLPMLALFVGVLFTTVINLAYQPSYIRAVRAANGQPVPEARLLPVALGGFLFTIGMFWFAWTASPEQCASWVPSVIALAFIGAGFNAIFQNSLNFLVDTYGIYAASSTAANTFLRSVLAAGLPLAAHPMIAGMKTGPAMSVLAAVSLILIPVPFVFMRYGKDLRKKSRFAPYKGDVANEESGDEEQANPSTTEDDKEQRAG
ncbi:MFS general substrate transporter [Thozetella sp. PMI_491]|nr:MFS general substrate transporter [Thozetella sp. PMI_491]